MDVTDNTHRSGCPINQTIEILGDKWSLLVLRDLMFGRYRHFRDLMAHSMEGIASNILADRLKTLLAEGRAVRVIASHPHLGAWGRRHRPVTEELSIRAEILEDGGPKLWTRFMAELRHVHLGAPKPKGPSVAAELQAAYEAAAARNATSRPAA